MNPLGDLALSLPASPSGGTDLGMRILATAGLLLGFVLAGVAAEDEWGDLLAGVAEAHRWERSPTGDFLLHRPDGTLI